MTGGADGIISLGTTIVSYCCLGHLGNITKPDIIMACPASQLGRFCLPAIIHMTGVTVLDVIREEDAGISFEDTGLRVGISRIL